jgi:hypothetical protein
MAQQRSNAASAWTLSKDKARTGQEPISRSQIEHVFVSNRQEIEDVAAMHHSRGIIEPAGYVLVKTSDLN